jgi:2'-5' RNA ligase
MSKSPEKIEDYPECDYLLVIQPHEDLYEKIIQCKNDFAEKYNAAACTFGKPHITLLRFTQVQVAEERLVRHIRAIATACAPVKIELRDFGSFPSHTIFINLVSKVQIQYMIRQLKSAQKLMKGSVKPHFITEPHITVARKLQPQQYEQAWKEYAQMPFTGRFIAGHLLLLKRSTTMRAYQVVTRFELMDQTVATTQGSLFS